MEQQQFEIIAGLIAGCEAAMITMADHLSRLNVLDKAALADHYDATAAALDENIKQRQLIQMVLRQVAQGLRALKPNDPDAIQKLFH